MNSPRRGRRRPMVMENPKADLAARLACDALAYYHQARGRHNVPWQRLDWEKDQFERALANRPLDQRIEILRKAIARFRTWIEIEEKNFPGLAAGAF